MSINDSPIYDFAGWIDLAPDFDWSKLGEAEDPSPDPDPAGGLYTADYRAEY